MSRPTNITLTEELRAEAETLGLNISEICRGALAERISAVKTARANHGDDFEPVQVLNRDDTPAEFVGSYLGEDRRGNLFYLTPKGNVAIVDDDYLREVVDGAEFVAGESDLYDPALEEVVIQVADAIGVPRPRVQLDI